MFHDREDAARQLATRLDAYRSQKPLVLTIPRGAAPMGKTLAGLLKGDFDVVLVRKLHAPFQPELAISAIDESGWSTLAPYAAEVGADPDYIAEEKRQPNAGEGPSPGRRGGLPARPRRLPGRRPVLLSLSPGGG